MPPLSGYRGMTLREPPVLAPASRRGLDDEVADQLREAIFRGYFHPGDYLRELSLASLMEVSRGPIRGALAQLESEGLVEVSRHRGARVANFALADVREIYALRESLETLAVRLAAKRAGQVDLSDAAALLQAMRADPGPSPATLAKLDMGFHAFFYALSGNSRLEIVWNSLRSQVLVCLLLRAQVAPPHASTSYEEHRAIFDAIAAGDPNTAEVLSRDHLRVALARLEAAADAADVWRPGGE
jgi:DNA-binding GntR family transcriptional regulator